MKNVFLLDAGCLRYEANQIRGLQNSTELLQRFAHLRDGPGAEDELPSAGNRFLVRCDQGEPAAVYPRYRATRCKASA